MEGTQHVCRKVLWDLEYAREKKGLPPLLGNTVVQCDCGVWYMLQRKEPTFREWCYSIHSTGLRWAQMSRRQRWQVRKILKEK